MKIARAYRIKPETDAAIKAEVTRRRSTAGVKVSQSKVIELAIAQYLGEPAIQRTEPYRSLLCRNKTDNHVEELETPRSAQDAQSSTEPRRILNIPK